MCFLQLAYLREQSSQKRGLADGTSEVNHNSENTPSTNGKVRLQHVLKGTTVRSKWQQVACMTNIFSLFDIN